MVSNSYRLVALCWIAALIGGCGGTAPNPKQQEHTETRAEYFRRNHKPTMTPINNGKIKVETAQDVDDGKVQYQTEDGKTWRVRMDKQADGTYRYGTPDPIK
jgi:hypothetical protein